MNGKRLLKEKDKKVKVIPIAKLIKILDAEFSKFVRKLEKGKCFTCGVQKDHKEMQAGHYESRKHKATRWDVRNVHCQCVACNVFKHGNMTVYALKMIEKYDKGILERLRKLTQQTIKLKAYELQDLIDFYKKENSTL